MARKRWPSGGVLKAATGAGVVAVALAGVGWLLWILDAVLSGLGVVPYRSGWGLDRFPIADLVLVVLAVVAMIVAGLVSWISGRWRERRGHRPRRRRVQATTRAGGSEPTDAEEFELSPWTRRVGVGVVILVGVLMGLQVLALVNEVVQGRGFVPFRDLG